MRTIDAPEIRTIATLMRRSLIKASIPMAFSTIACCLAGARLPGDSSALPRPDDTHIGRVRIKCRPISGKGWLGGHVLHRFAAPRAEWGRALRPLRPSRALENLMSRDEVDARVDPVALRRLYTCAGEGTTI